MKKSIKDIGGDSTIKTFTVRIQESIIEKIRERAESLDMNNSYYAAAVFALEENHRLLDQFPDPLAKSGDEITAEDALALVRKLQQSGVDVKSILSPGSVPLERVVIPPDPNKVKKVDHGEPIPKLPQMRSIADLVRLNAQRNLANPDPAIDAALAGDTGVSTQLRAQQLKEAQEERAERAMREQILGNLPEANEGKIQNEE